MTTYFHVRRLLAGPYFFLQESHENLSFLNSAQPLKMISSEIESMCEKVRERESTRE